LTADLTSTDLVPNMITNTILGETWSVSTDGGNHWFQIGATANREFVSVSPGTAYETVLDVSTRGIPGGTAPTATQTIINGIWNQFSSRTLENIRHATLQYYGSQFAINDPPVGAAAPDNPLTLAGLMNHGAGRCQAWASFLQAALQIQGVASTQISIRSRLGHPFHPLLPAGVDPNQNGFYVLRPGQGGTTFNQLLLNHSLVEIGPDINHCVIYDPSYGGTPFAPAPADEASQLWAWQKRSVTLWGWVIPPDGPTDIVVEPANDGFLPNNQVLVKRTN
jgi:hypothetical protein